MKIASHLTLVADPGDITKRHEDLFCLKVMGRGIFTSHRENLTQQKGKWVKILYLFVL